MEGGRILFISKQSNELHRVASDRFPFVSSSLPSMETEPQRTAWIFDSLLDRLSNLSPPPLAVRRIIRENVRVQRWRQPSPFLLLNWIPSPPPPFNLTSLVRETCGVRTWNSYARSAFSPDDYEANVRIQSLAATIWCDFSRISVNGERWSNEISRISLQQFRSIFSDAELFRLFSIREQTLLIRTIVCNEGNGCLGKWADNGAKDWNRLTVE